MVTTLDVWARIRHRYATEQISKRELAKHLGISRGTVDRAPESDRGTVDRAPESDRPPKHERAPAGSDFDAYPSQGCALLARTPTMPATVLAERVGMDWIRVAVPRQGPPDPAGVPAGGSAGSAGP